MSSMLSWLIKTPKSNLPEPTALQSQRTRQIEQLRTFDNSISEIQRDVEYRIVITDVLALYIFLPPLFPQEKPVVRISPSGRHPWVNEQSIVTGCFSLNNFMIHSDLSKVIREIVEEFRQNPPVPVSTTASCGLSSQWPSSLVPASSAFITSNSQMTTSQQAAVNPLLDFQLKAPETYQALQELKDLPIGDIKALLEDDDKILELLEPKLAELQTAQQHLVEMLDKTAKENVTRKSLLEDKKRILLEKIDLLTDLRHKFDKLLQHQDDLHCRYDLNLVQDNLKVAALQAEEKAEAVAENFLTGSISVEEFSRNFMTERMLYHLRRAKEEKLSQSIRQRLRTF